MDRFVHRENIKHYRGLLDRTDDEGERQRILKLMAEEQARVELDAPLPKRHP